MHIWDKHPCYYFVVWTAECNLAVVLVESDDRFTKEMELLKNFLFTIFYPYLALDRSRKRTC